MRRETARFRREFAPRTWTVSLRRKGWWCYQSDVKWSLDGKQLIPTSASAVNGIMLDIFTYQMCNLVITEWGAR